MLDLRQLSLSGARGEKIDTQRALLVAEALAVLHEEADWPLDRLSEVLAIPAHNELPRLDRAAEMLRVWTYYPREFLELAYRYPAPWHLLVEPTSWDDARVDQVVAVLRDHLERRGSWPSIGLLRANFGRQSNHRSVAEKTPGQDSLGGVA